MIRELNIDELPLLFEGAELFSNSSQFLEVNPTIFVRNWTEFIGKGIGVIFASIIEEKVAGAIGGFKHPCINTGALIASEFFWYVMPNHRGTIGIRLLNTFENWAKEKGCLKVTMTHLSDSMPDKLKRLYERRDYKKIETNYIKEL